MLFVTIRHQISLHRCFKNHLFSNHAVPCIMTLSCSFHGGLGRQSPSLPQEKTCLYETREACHISSKMTLVVLEMKHFWGVTQNTLSLYLDLKDKIYLIKVFTHTALLTTHLVHAGVYVAEVKKKWRGERTAFLGIPVLYSTVVL